MLGVDPEIGTSALRLWVAAGSAALLVVLCALAFFPLRWRIPALGVGFVVLAAVLGAAMTWAFLERAVGGDQGAERRALEQRANELTARSLAPGSPLSCLDALAGESVEAACEKVIFASPASVATATSYVAARLALLSEVVAYVGRGGANIDDVLTALRRSLDADRFGFLAHLLATRDGCTNQNCKALALLDDASHVRANLSGGTLDRYLDHYLTIWAAAPDGSVADVAQAQPATAPQSNAQGQRKVSVSIDFPTAASIPPVSIMNPEPSGPVLPGVAAAAAANPNPQPAAPSPSHRSHKQTAAPAPPPAAQATPSGPAAIEPIWPEPVPPPPQAVTASPAPAPVQLNPFPPPLNASAGTTVRAQ
jgi:hypothetical protein